MEGDDEEDDVDMDEVNDLLKDARKLRFSPSSIPLFTLACYAHFPCLRRTF